MNEIDGFFVIFWVIFGFIMLMTIAVSLLTVIGQWKVFEKAGKPGWAALIPIYNYIIMMEIAELPTWYIVLYFIPFANIYVQVITYLEIVKRFGEGPGFAIGMLFFPYIFWLILGGKSYKYQKVSFKYCPQCGAKLDGNVNFCSKCGYKFN